MIMFTNGFVITAICKYDVVGHLVENIRKFNILDYTIEEVKTAKGAGETEKGFRVTVHAERNAYTKIMEYLKQYYVKDYGIILYYHEVFQPM